MGQLRFHDDAMKLHMRNGIVRGEWCREERHSLVLSRRMHDRRTCRQIYGVTTASYPLSRSITRAHAGHCSCCHPESCSSWRGSEGDADDDVGQRHVALTSERERETNEMGNQMGEGREGLPSFLRHWAISSFFFTFSSSSSLLVPLVLSFLLSTSLPLPLSLSLRREGGQDPLLLSD